jgi:hypothetical protein
MKDLIRNILREDSHLEVLKKYFFNIWENQVNSGEIPKIGYVDVYRKKLSKYIDQIDKWYFDFVGGEDEAFKLFDQYMTNLKITDKDLRNSNQPINPNDYFEVMITRIYDEKYERDGELEFGFYIIGGTFDTSDGQLTYEELMDEHYDDIILDVENWLRGELEGYVHTIQLDFGLDYLDVTSQWDN